MAAIAVDLPSRATVLALLPLVALMLGLLGWTLFRLARAETSPYLPKWLWAVIILLSIPWGAIAYLLLAHNAPAAVTDLPSPGPSPALAAQVAPPAMDVDTPPVVSTQSLTRDFGSGAGLFDVDLRVPGNVVYGLVGPNGAGKSTLLSILAGVRRADSGVVRIGVTPTAVAVCPDVPEFEPWLTAFEVVDLARHYVAPHLGAESVWQALRTTDLADAADRRVAGFSRGMTQRLGLAAALVGDPQLLLLDEPTSALDPAGRAQILELIAAMRGERTVIFSSHILADVQRVADHVGVLRAGRLVYQGETRTLIDEHLTPSWLIRLSGSVDDVVRKLHASTWVRRAEVISGDEIRVDADTMSHGEQGIPEVLASCRAGLIACEPRAAGLEAAFLAVTGNREGS